MSCRALSRSGRRAQSLPLPRPLRSGDIAYATTWTWLCYTALSPIAFLVASIVHGAPVTISLVATSFLVYPVFVAVFAFIISLVGGLIALLASRAITNDIHHATASAALIATTLAVLASWVFGGSPLLLLSPGDVLFLAFAPVSALIGVRRMTRRMYRTPITDKNGEHDHP